MPIKRTRNNKTIWRGRITLPNGKRKEKTCQTKKEAQEWEISMRSKITSILNQGTTCGEWLDTRLNNYITRNAGSITEKARTYKRFFEDIDHMTPCSMLTAEMVLKHLDRIASEISKDRANRTRKHLSEAWKWGVKFKELPTKNPFTGIPDYNTGIKKEKYVPPLEDFWKVVDAAPGYQDKVLLRTYYYTAARRSELTRLTWSEDLRLEQNIIRLSTRKGRKGSWKTVWVVLPEPHILDLKKWKLQSAFSGDRDLVFCDQMDGNPIRDISHYMIRLCDQAGVKRFGFHGIRHMVAVNLYMGGHTVAEIQQLLRHEHPTTTETYLRSLGVHLQNEQVINTLTKKRGDLKGDLAASNN